MPKIVDNINIVKRSRDRFRLRETSEPEQVIWANVVVPVTSADELLSDSVNTQTTITRTAVAGAGWATIATVDDNEKWNLVGCLIERTGGDATITKLAIGETAASVVPIYSQTAAANMYTNLLNPQVELPASWILQVYYSAITGDSTFTFNLIYRKQNSF